MKQKKVSELQGLICFLCVAVVGLPMSGDRPGVFNLSGPYALCALRKSSSAFDIFTSEFWLLPASLFVYFDFFSIIYCAYIQMISGFQSLESFFNMRNNERKFMVLSSYLFLFMIAFRCIYIIIFYISFVLWSFPIV